MSHPTTEELGRQLATLQKQLSRIRLQSLLARVAARRGKVHPETREAVEEAASEVNSQIYIHEIASDALDRAESLLEMDIWDLGA